MPFSRCLHQVNRREVPLNAVWVSSIIAFCMALTVRPDSKTTIFSRCVALRLRCIATASGELVIGVMCRLSDPLIRGPLKWGSQSLGSLVAFQAMVSIATIGLYISYALPILFRVTIARKSFHRGPFNLGRYGEFVGWVAVLWVALITVLFCLPVVYPVTKLTLNYAPVAVGGVFVLVLGVWVLSARKWFKGPQFNVVSPFKD